MSAAGWVAGISFQAGGTAQFIGAPSGDTVAVFLNGGTDQITFAAPVQSIQFSYATGYASTLTGYDQNGNVVAGPLNIPSNWDGKTPYYRAWTQIPPLQAQGGGNVISSVTIQSAATLNNFLGIDNLQVCGAFTIAGVEMTQAIQQYQNITDLETSLANTGEPPVPIIAFKPGVIRIYVNPPLAPRSVNIELSIPDIDFDQMKSPVLMPNCQPNQQRLPQNGCSSTDFYFTPGIGSWTATISVTDPDTEILMEQQTLPFNSRTTKRLVIKGIEVCAEFNGQTWFHCGHAARVLDLLGLLTQLAPTASVVPVVSNHGEGFDYSQYKAQLPDLDSEHLDTTWWSTVVQKPTKLWAQNDSVSDRELGTYTTEYGVVYPHVAPECCGGMAYNHPSHAAAGLTQISYYIDVDATEQVLAHEVGHTLGGPHTGVLPPSVPTDTNATSGCYELSKAITPDWPFPSNYIQSLPEPPATINLEVGFNVSTNTSSATVPFGQVISETPAAGTSVSAGAGVNLTISLGGALSISLPAALPAGDAGAVYVAVGLTAAGGTMPYTWSAAGLPNGLTIDPLAGVISGAPQSTAGSPFSVTVNVTDSNSVTANKMYNLTVNPALALTGPASLPAGTVGANYTAPALTATGGSGFYSWFASGLPPGLRMGQATGAITGVPSNAALSPFSVQVLLEDSNGAAVNGGYTVAINPGNGSFCDLNRDGVVSVADVQFEINQALGTPAANNDLNDDGVVNVVDIQILINAVLQLGCLAF
jgi:hypothetical protein